MNHSQYNLASRMVVCLSLTEPVIALISGATASGKSTLIARVIESADKLFCEPPAHWYYYYGVEGASLPRHLPAVSFIRGVPDEQQIEQFCDGKSHTAVVIDDGMLELRKSDFLTALVTRLAHHKRISVFIITQALFDVCRVTRINCNYFFLLKNPSDTLSIANLARQIFPGKVKGVLDAFQDATKEPHGVLCINLTQQCPEEYRICTDIFNDLTVYLPK